MDEYQDLGSQNGPTPPPRIPSAQPVPPQPPYWAQVPPQPKPRRSGWRVFWWFLFVSSIFGNVALFLMLIGTVAMVAMGSQSGLFEERVVQDGPRTAKVAIVSVDGVIDDEQAARFQDQLDMAATDRAVKAVVVRVDSPGGTISGSDRIYNALTRFKAEYNRPVVAFMEGIAASGGYYTSVGCDQIVAEPTAITGSIGVIMSHFVLEDLMKDKLGVLPVVIKSGQKKDWPSSYHAPTDEETAYLEERLIQPAYARFLEVVAEGRRHVLSIDEIRPLADGGIYSAQQAMDNKLIDRIGYQADAVDLAMSLADLPDAEVVEYREAFSLSQMLGVTSPAASLRIDRKTLHALTTPEVMYLWKAY